MYSTPILFLVFNRPDVTRQSFEAIKKMQPKQLFVAADGPRVGNANDAVKCKETRQLILDGVDWDCELKTLFRAENLGCGMGVSGAISWFFSQVDQGIIVEDDIVPNESFFFFTAELLEKYKHTDNVGVVCGQASVGQRQEKGPGETYYFSKYPRIWGWASWSRVWKKYNVGLQNTRFEDIAESLTAEEKEYWQPLYSKYHVVQEKYDTWDYQLTMTLLANKLLAAIPNMNLVSNVGFGTEATHTFDAASPFANNPTETIQHILHPSAIKTDAGKDRLYFRKQLGGGKPDLYTRFKIKILKMMGKL